MSINRCYSKLWFGGETGCCWTGWHVIINIHAYCTYIEGVHVVNCRNLLSHLYRILVSVCVDLTFAVQNLFDGEPEALVIGHVEDWVNTATGVRNIERVEAVLSDIFR